MLDLNYIRNNKEEILTGLDKRNFEAPQLLDDIIALDQQRAPSKPNWMPF